MSTPFTDPATDGFDCLHIDNVAELYNAYCERRMVDVVAPDEGDIATWNSTDISFCKMQAWMPPGASDFVNDENETYDPHGVDRYPVMYTTETFAAAAGLHYEGSYPDAFSGQIFRRVWAWNANEYPTIPWGDGPVDTEDLAWDYGYIADGDILGYWIYEDLQKGFTVMRWTRKATRQNAFPGNTGAFMSFWGDSTWSEISASNCPTQLYNFRTLWTTGGTGTGSWGGWQAGGELSFISTDAVKVIGQWVCIPYPNNLTKTQATGRAARRRAYWTIANIPTKLAHRASAYVLLTKASGAYAFVGEHAGMVEDKVWCLHGDSGMYPEFSLAISDTHTTDVLGDVDTFPADIAPLNYQVSNTTPWWILKWEFTYGNVT